MHWTVTIIVGQIWGCQIFSIHEDLINIIWNLGMGNNAKVTLESLIFVKINFKRALFLLVHLVLLFIFPQPGQIK